MRWIVFSPKRPNLPKDEVGIQEEEGADENLSQLKQIVREEDFGKLVSNKVLISFWEMEWKAFVIQTDKGFYTDIEWIKQNN